MTTHRPLVAIPTYNNAATVADVARRCLKQHPHVVVIDDGSTDGSGDAARAVTTVIAHPVNRGKGAALVTALDHAAAEGFSHVIAVDADGQHLPEDLPLFLDAARSDPDAIHLGVRDMSTAPESSRFGRRFSNFWIWVETGHHVGDSQTGYRVYPVVPVRSLRFPVGRYEWEVEVLTRALWAGIAVRDVACRVFYPPKEERVSSFRPFHDNARISWLNTRLVAGRILWPPRWFNRVSAPGERWKGGWKGGHQGRLWGWRFFVNMVGLIGRWPAYVGMVGMATWYLLLAAQPRRGLMAYLRRRFPQANTLGRWARAWRAYLGFACSLVDRFAMIRSGPETFQLTRENTAAAQAAVQAGGAIVLTAHMGNPDLGASALRSGVPRVVNMVQYHDQNDPYVTLIREALGERAPRIIALNSGDELASLEVVRALRRGEIVAMKTDRLVDARSVTVPFLGGDIRLPSGPLLLAALSRAPVFLMGCFKEGSDTYRVITTDPRVLRFSGRGPARERDLQRWGAEIAEQLEEWTERWPLQWYNFHDLWKR